MPAFCVIINKYMAAPTRAKPDYFLKAEALLESGVFEDILLLNNSAIKEILAKVDRKILTAALKGTSDQMKNHMLQAMSQRGAEMLREDMDKIDDPDHAVVDDRDNMFEMLRGEKQ